MLRLVAVLIALACLACSPVKMNDSGKKIRMMDSEVNLGSCELKGEITASVADRIAFVRREPAKVADEVETLARNDASSLGADTLVPVSDLIAGERKFKAFRCK